MAARKMFALLAACSLLLAPACRLSAPASAIPSARFAFQPALRHQTIEGWGGLLANWHWVDGASGPSTPIANDVEQALLRELVFDLGLNRFGLNFPAGMIEPVNDNNNPRDLNPAGFDFSSLEPYVREQLLPLRELLQERGEKLILYGSAILYRPKNAGRGTPRFVVEDPEEYVEFAMASLEFLRGFGLEPDYWMLINEPDLTRVWTPAQLADRVLRLGRRLRDASYATRICAPETVHPTAASSWLAALAATPGVRDYLGAISYHSYDYDPTIGERPPASPRASLANWGRALSLPVAQTEQGQAGKKNARTRWDGLQHEHALDVAENIFADLLYANAGAWQLHAAFGWADEGQRSIGGAYLSASRDGLAYSKPVHYWAVRHFSHWLRPGAVRVALQPLDSSSPVLAAAFLTPAGQPVIVAMNRGARAHELRIDGLPAARYRVSLTTPGQQAAEQPLAPLPAGDSLRFTLTPGSLATFFTNEPPAAVAAP